MTQEKISLDKIGLPSAGEKLSADHLLAHQLYTSAQAVRIHINGGFDVDYQQPKAIICRRPAVGGGFEKVRLEQTLTGYSLTREKTAHEYE